MEYKSCIDACRRCAAECELCLDSLSRVSSSTEQLAAIRTVTDCAQFCRTTAGFLERESRFVMAVCGLCAEMCDACVAGWRLVARGNYSRIGIARVKFNEAGDPVGVERLGIALEPEADYELRPDGGGGCEDPRITFVEPLQRYMMTYAALSPIGPRIAVAESEDLFHWKRLGLATFAPYHGIDFVNVDNKDASLFPVAVPNHAGKLQMAMLHRPLFPGTRPEETVYQGASRVVDLDHESIWISYLSDGL